MNSYFRFSIITLFFSICIIYVLIPRNRDVSGWKLQDRQEFLTGCIGNIGTEELCKCVMNKLQTKFTSLDDMYKNPQMVAETMKAVSLECKK